MRVPSVPKSASPLSTEIAKGPIYQAAYKSLWVAYALYLLGAGGGLGLHRFYLGYARSGAALLALFVSYMALGISQMGQTEIFGVPLSTITYVPLVGWALLDLFLIPRMRRHRNGQIAREIDREIDAWNA